MNNLKEVSIKKIVFILFFIFLIALSINLRVKALDWGIGENNEFKNYTHFFHPDEDWSMRVIEETDLRNFDFLDGYKEGVLSYYKWGLISKFVFHVGITTELPNKEISQSQRLKYLKIFRSSVVFFGILTLLLLGILVFKLSDGNVIATLVSVLALALNPFDIIHSQFFRPHTIGNFYIVAFLLLFYSYKDNLNIKKIFIISILFSFAVSTRYDLVLLISIPLFYYFLIEFKKFSFLSTIRSVFTIHFKNFLFFFLFFLLIFFLFHYKFITDFPIAKEKIYYQLKFSDPSSFSLKKIFSLQIFFDAFRYLFIQGSLPFLWILYFMSIFFCFLSKKNFNFFLAVLLSIIFYIFVKTKGYNYYAIRSIYIVYPLFSIFVGMACNEILKNVNFKKFLFFFYLIIFFLLLPSLCFSYKYNFYQMNDNRFKLYQFLENNIKKEKAVIALPTLEHYNYFLLYPITQNLSKKILFITIENLIKNDLEVDYVLLVSQADSNESIANKNVKEDLIKNNYKVIQNYNYNFKFFIFNYKLKPLDLTYPLIEIIILKKMK